MTDYIYNRKEENDLKRRRDDILEKIFLELEKEPVNSYEVRELIQDYKIACILLEFPIIELKNLRDCDETNGGK